MLDPPEVLEAGDCQRRGPQPEGAPIRRPVALKHAAKHGAEAAVAALCDDSRRLLERGRLDLRDGELLLSGREGASSVGRLVLWRRRCKMRVRVRVRRMRMRRVRRMTHHEPLLLKRRRV